MLLAAPLLVIVMETISASSHREPECPSPVRRAAASAAQARWITGGDPRRLGIRWAILLIIVQIAFSFTVTILMQLGSYEGPSALLSLFVPWYLITLPSAVYFMIIVGLQWRHSKRILIPSFLVLASYSGVLWPNLVQIYVRNLQWLPFFEKSTRLDKSRNALLLHVVALAILVAAYIFYVMVTALVRKRSLRAGVGETSTIQV